LQLFSAHTVKFKSPFLNRALEKEVEIMATFPHYPDVTVEEYLALDRESPEVRYEYMLCTLSSALSSAKVSKLM
jgi:hypothetical protein